MNSAGCGPRFVSIASILAMMASACGDRDKVWDRPIGAPQTLGMSDAVAIVDDAGHRVLFAAPAPAGGGLGRASFEVGHNVVRAVVSRDRNTLFVVSAGDQPRRSDEDQRPELRVFSRKPDGTTTTRSYALASALSGLTVDPLGRYVALHADTTQTTPSTSKPFVENPNEVIIVDLTAPEGSDAPVARTLRSFGGKPQRFTFTPTLALPGGPRRLLVVETEQDVALVDLDHLRDVPERPEITVRLGSGSTNKVLKPAGLVVDDGDPARTDDARIAIRVANDSALVTLTLGPAVGPGPGQTAAPNPNDFSPAVNLVDVGGPATDVAVVRTDGGLRIAAIVPSTSSAMLVEPETGLTERVPLAASYERVSLITTEVAKSNPTDVALLWGGRGSGSGVAFWSLGRTSGQPYRAVEIIGVGGIVQAVRDVPPPRPELKVLELTASTATNGTTGGAVVSSPPGFVILNLRDRTAAPLVSSGSAVSLEIASDGERAWAFQKGSTSLASVALANAHPLSLQVERPIDSVFDLATPDGNRALLTIHARGAMGATLFDARAPDPARAVAYSGLLLEGLP